MGLGPLRLGDTVGGGMPPGRAPGGICGGVVEYVRGLPVVGSNCGAI
jgi:hypothetical protein